MMRVTLPPRTVYNFVATIFLAIMTGVFMYYRVNEILLFGWLLLLFALWLSKCIKIDGSKGGNNGRRKKKMLFL